MTAMQALGKALTEMTAAGRDRRAGTIGFAGTRRRRFPGGLKWKFVRKAPGDKKYVICNADESEPGTFKDRLVLEGDPHAIVEAMTIAAYAVGADEGYIYIRGEYDLAQQRVHKAIEQAREMGLLGENIFGSDFNFDHSRAHRARARTSAAKRPR